MPYIISSLVSSQGLLLNGPIDHLLKQNTQFKSRLQKPYSIRSSWPYLRPKLLNSIPYLWPRRLKKNPLGPHIPMCYIANVREYPPRFEYTLIYETIPDLIWLSWRFSVFVDFLWKNLSLEKSKLKPLQSSHGRGAKIFPRREVKNWRILRHNKK